MRKTTSSSPSTESPAPGRSRIIDTSVSGECTRQGVWLHSPFTPRGHHSKRALRSVVRQGRRARVSFPIQGKAPPLVHVCIYQVVVATYDSRRHDSVSHPFAKGLYFF
jgi:hypothetical protein